MIVLKDIPTKGFHWGWYSREDQRMHLQIVSRKHAELKYKVWLERQGRRVFEPNDELAQAPRKTLQAIHAQIEEKRWLVEREWASFLIENQWINLRLSGSMITISVYPRQPTSYTRTVDLAEILAGIYSPTSQLIPEHKIPPGPDDIGLNEDMAAIEVFRKRPENRRHHLYLPDILFQD